MPEGLVTLDGRPVEVKPSETVTDHDEVNRDFARAMAEPVNDIPAPPLKPEKPAAERKPRGRPPKSARTAKAPETASTPEQDAQRSAGVAGLMQLGAGLCLMLDQRTPDQDVSFKADAVTLVNNAEVMADACVQTAKANPKFGAVLDKICNAGPYAALMTATLGIGMQVAVNHGRLSAGFMGTVKPEELVGDAVHVQD